MKKRGGFSTSNAIQGAASFGRAMGFVNMLGGCLMGVSMISLGIFIATRPRAKPDPKTPPSNATIWIGVILSLVGLLIIGGSIMWYRYIQRNKMAAAYSGASEGVGMLGSAFGAAFGSASNSSGGPPASFGNSVPGNSQGF